MSCYAAPLNVHNHQEQITRIADLQIGVSGQVTAGLIITKQDVKSYMKNNGEERAQVSFTIRDNTANVNCTCWGSSSHIRHIFQCFQINDVIKVSNCLVQVKPDTEQEQLYQPTTSAPFRIQIDQKNSTIEPMSEVGDQYLSVLHIPATKDPGNFVTLQQIENLHSAYLDKHINVLVIIKTPPNRRSITTKKDGRSMTCCDLEVLDQTKQTIKLVLWTESLADLVCSLPVKTLLFLTDVKVKLDSYTESPQLVSSPKTIITVNPDTSAGHMLYKFSETLLPADLVASIKPCISSSIRPTSNIANIDKVYTIDSILSESPENGILSAVLTHFTCTPPGTGVSKKCTGCNKKVHGLCPKTQCFGKEALPYYDFTVALSDHTGTIDKVKLTGDCAEKLIAAPVATYQGWDSTELSMCQANLVLERYKVKFTTFDAPSGLWLSVVEIETWVPSLHSGS